MASNNPHQQMEVCNNQRFVGFQMSALMSALRKVKIERVHLDRTIVKKKPTWMRYLSELFNSVSRPSSAD